jgi:DNA-binding XRE family transcriptional regulator
MAKEKTVAELMRQWRRLMDYNTAQAGEFLGLSDRAIEDIEQGRRRDGDKLTAIALRSLMSDAGHEFECRDAALAAVAERERKVSKSRK